MEIEVVSKVLYTQRYSEVFVGRDLSGQLFLCCEGCKQREFKAGLAPALAAITEHSKTCSK